MCFETYFCNIHNLIQELRYIGLVWLNNNTNYTSTIVDGTKNSKLWSNVACKNASQLLRNLKSNQNRKNSE